MSGEAPTAAPFAMVGDAEAPVCVDGVCEAPAPEVPAPEGAAPADDATGGTTVTVTGRADLR